MQRLGHVLHLSSSGNMILRAENLPRIGAKVVNQNLEPVGTVYDIFGPVSSPYIAVKPQGGSSQDLITRTLYSASSHRPKRRKRR